MGRVRVYAPLMSADEIFNDDGMRVTRKRVLPLTMESCDELLSVEVTVIGGEWAMGPRTIERLHEALGAWLDSQKEET